MLQRHLELYRVKVLAGILSKRAGKIPSLLSLLLQMRHQSQRFLRSTNYGQNFLIFNLDPSIARNEA